MAMHGLVYEYTEIMFAHRLSESKRGEIQFEHIHLFGGMFIWQMTLLIR